MPLGTPARIRGASQPRRFGPGAVAGGPRPALPAAPNSRRTPSAAAVPQVPVMVTTTCNSWASDSRTAHERSSRHLPRRERESCFCTWIRTTNPPSMPSGVHAACRPRIARGSHRGGDAPRSRSPRRPLRMRSSPRPANWAAGPADRRGAGISAAGEGIPRMRNARLHRGLPGVLLHARIHLGLHNASYATFENDERDASAPDYWGWAASILAM